MAKVDKQYVESLLVRYGSHEIEVAETFRSLGEDAVQPLVDVLRSNTNERIRERAVDALDWIAGEDGGVIRPKDVVVIIRSKNAVAGLMIALDDLDPWVRCGAGEALIELHVFDALPYLHKLLDDKTVLGYSRVCDCIAKDLHGWLGEDAKPMLAMHGLA